MAARKLQSEIDRTLKKVSEGVELFESIYDKMQASTNQTQKEKQETDLKTQIKKLQRLRDQIKTWVASSDIKDKSALVENRKLIETQMEKFKACEKEMKTKTFSKEGLMASTKLDPAEQEKNIAMQWIQEKVEALQQQVEQAEAEIESLQAGGKKKKTNSAASERLEGLEHWNERRKWHISRLEIILRLLDNGSLKADKVKDLQEDVTYFIDSNQEDGYEEDEGIYDDFNLDEQEELFGLNADNDDAAESVSESASESVSLPQRTPSKKHEDEVVSIKREREREREPASPLLKKAGVTVIPRRVSAAAESKPPPNLNFSQTPMSSVVKAGIARPPAQLPVRYAAAAAAAVNSSAAHPPAHPPSAAATPATAHAPIPVPAAAPSQPTVTPAPAVVPPAPSVTDSPSLTHASVASPLLSSAASAALEGSLYSARQSPALSEAIASSSPQRRIATVDTAAKHEPSHTTTNGTAVSSAVASPAISTAAPAAPPGVSSVATTATAATAPATSPTTATQAAFPPVASSPSQPTGTEAQASVPKPESQTQQMPGQQTPSQTPGGQQRIAGSLADLVSSFESVKQKAATRMADLDSVHKLLEGGHGGAPQPLDTEKAKYYVPKNPWQTPSYYPQQPHPLLSRPEIFAQLEVETLFWIFYYNPGTYQQYLAARELKKQSWRFHVKYLTWFQRHSEPQAITDEYEQGVYVYFDWESSWCQRRKNDFRFEYRYLSED